MQELIKNKAKGILVLVLPVLFCSHCIPVTGEDIGFGVPIRIVEEGGEYSNSGEFILTVDGAHICKGVSDYLDNGMKALGVQCVIENIS